MSENLFETLTNGAELTTRIREMQNAINNSIFLQAEVAVRPEGGGIALRIKNGKHDRLLICVRAEGESLFVRTVEKRGDLRIKTPWALFQEFDVNGTQKVFSADEMAIFVIGSVQHLQKTTDAKIAQFVNSLLEPLVMPMIMNLLSKKTKPTPVD